MISGVNIIGKKVSKVSNKQVLQAPMELRSLGGRSDPAPEAMFSLLERWGESPHLEIPPWADLELI